MASRKDETKWKLCWAFCIAAIVFLAAFAVLHLRSSSQPAPLAYVLLFLGYACVLTHMVFRVSNVPDAKQRRLILILGIIGATCLLASFPVGQYVFIGWPRSIGADLFALAGLVCMIVYESKYQTNKERVA